MTRISDQTLATQRMDWINRGRSQGAEVERDLATGQKLHRPSQDPAAASQLMRHEVRLQRLQQYERNQGVARLWINGADTALQSAANGLGRAKTLAVQAGNTTLGPVENAALAADIRAVADAMQTIRDSQISGRSIFEGDGNNGVVQIDIDTAEAVTIGLVADDVFGTANIGDPLNGTAIETLNALADAVEVGDVATIRAGIEAVDNAAERIGSAQGQVGAISRQIDAADLRQSLEQTTVEADISKIRDTDMAEAIIRLRSIEAGTQATLSATARGLSTSLLDFLR
jgi:flagellar hook-associated protein 3 FlgL